MDEDDKDLDRLYPKWICPLSGDWFHMPWKFCSSPREEFSLQMFNGTVLNSARNEPTTP